MKRSILFALLISLLASSVAFGGQVDPAQVAKWSGVRERVKKCSGPEDNQVCEYAPWCEHQYYGSLAIFCTGVVLRVNPDAGELLVDAGGGSFQNYDDPDNPKDFLPTPMVLTGLDSAIFVNSTNIKDFKPGDWFAVRVSYNGTDGEAIRGEFRKFPEHPAGEIEQARVTTIVKNPKEKRLIVRSNSEADFTATVTPELYYFPETEKEKPALLRSNMHCQNSICTYSLGPESEVVFNGNELMSVKLPISMQSEISSLSAKSGKKITAGNITGFFKWVMGKYYYYTINDPRSVALELLYDLTKKINNGNTDQILELILRYQKA